MATVEFRNESGLKFVDISSEEYRKYTFPSAGSGGAEFSHSLEVKIDNPLQLHVSKNGHRVFDAQGVSHYIPGGWVHLEWKAREGKPHFVK